MIIEENTSFMKEECLIEKRRTEILKECSELLKGDNRYTRETFRKLFQEQIFLEKLFGLFDQDRDELLKQDEWIEFMKGRLTNEKQQDFIDQIETVAFVLCAEKPLNFTSFVQLFCAKGIVDKLFRLIDQENSGYVTTIQIMEFINDVSNPRPRGGFDKRSLEWLENIFKQTVGNQKEIRREEFKKIVTSKNPFFTERVFQIFDKDNSGTISLQEFIDAMNEFAGKSADDKIKFLFKVYDIDDDGFIQYRELEHVMRACMEENGMKFSDEQIEELTIALFEDADTCNRGAITLEGLKKQLEKHDGFLENLSISIDRWLVPPKPKDTKKPILHGFLSSLQPHQLTMPYIKNNYVYITFICIILTINLILFVTRIIEYRQSNVYVILARACGQCLNFNCTFVLVLMLRQCITFLRINGFSSVLPLDHHIYLHKMTGILIVIFGFIHTFMHLLNFGTIVINDEKLNNSNYTMAEWIFTSKPKLFGLVGGCANPTGIALTVILIIMTVCSLPFVRKGGCFEIFYWSHLLYVPFWILMIFHGPNFWKWFVVPGTIYLLERIRRLVWSRSQRGKTYIRSGLLLPSKVTHLVIKRPPNFDFHPGDYVFVNIPVIARYEWHPFTISSAPELKDYIWLHIRALGEWTNTLYLYFEKEHVKLHRGDDLSVDGATSNNVNLTRKKSFLSVNMGKKNKDDSLSDSRGIDNLVFVPDVKASSSSNSTINNTGTFLKTPECTPKMIKMTEEPKLRQFLLASKIPLEKSFSVPDMQTRYKNKQRSIALRDYGRSESERSFDEGQIRRACTKFLGRAYLSPQNKSLAESVRYMRTKPTIIAFETPSLENFEYDEGTNSNNSPSMITENKNWTSPTCSIGQEAAEEGKLNDISKEMKKNDKTKSIEIKIETASSSTTIDYPVGKPLEIFLDGPYGAPSSHIFQAQHAVLIATGIGVTPFASILRSIMHRYWEARQTCPNCQFSWANEIPPTIMHLRKVDFFWINRDQHSFEWFVNLLSQLEMEQAELGNAKEPFLEMYMYITSALQKHDMKAVGLQLAMDLLHEKEKRDLITGLKTRTNAGRPNWDKVFKQLQDQKKGKITVFYCGPPQLAKILRHKCDQFGFKFRKESF